MWTRVAKPIVVGLLLHLAAPTIAAAATSVSPVRLRARYFVHGDSSPPGSVRGRRTHGLELSWRLAAPAGAKGFDVRQSAYRVGVVCGSGDTEVVSSGMVPTGQTTHRILPDQVSTLPPHQVCRFRVSVWSGAAVGGLGGAGAAAAAGARTDAESAAFPTLPRNGTLAGGWITAAAAAEDSATTLLRRRFAAPGTIESAVVSISGLGQYELTLNGARVGDHMMDPGWTKYTVNGTCLFATYDVTALVKSGVDNVVGVFLGNGMYNNVGPRYHKWTGSSGPRTVAFELTLTAPGGGSTTVLSDEDWETSTGPITFNGVYGGEDHNASLEQPGWDTPAASPPPTATWTPAVKAAGPGCTLRPQLQPPVKIREQMPDPNVTSYGRGVFVYDFKQEFGGWPVLTVQGKAGTVVRMTPAEFTGSDGMPDQHFGPAYWQYTLRGTGGPEVYRPKFFTYGFRFLTVQVLVPGASPTPSPPLPPNMRFIKAASQPDVYFETVANMTRYHVPECGMCHLNVCSMLVTVTDAYMASLKTGDEFSCAMLPPPPAPKPGPSPGSAGIVGIGGEFVYSSAPIVGNFSCSDGLFNRIHQMILAAMKSNLQSIFHDCPHRERLGWLEQSWLLAKSVGHNFDVSQLYAKMVGDMAEAQTASGMVPDIAPEYVVFNGGFRDSPEWGIAFPMVTAFLVDQYNDTDTLRRFYPAMVRYIDYLTHRADPASGLVKYGLGDWVKVGDKSPIGVTASMVYLEGLATMGRMAQIVNEPADAARFATQMKKVVAGYNAAYLDKGDAGSYTGSQTATAMAITLGAAADDDKSTAWLVGSVAANGNHSICGEIGWPYMVRSLVKMKQDAVLEAIVSRTDNPSYGYNLAQGATTLTETWDASRSDSWNHAMLGHIDAWFFEHVAGLKAAPVVGPTLLVPKAVHTLEHAQVVRDLPTGTLTMRWDRERGRSGFRVTVAVPPGAEVHLVLPTEEPRRVRIDGSAMPMRGTAHAIRLPNSTHRAHRGVALDLAAGRHLFEVLPE